MESGSERDEAGWFIQCVSTCLGLTEEGAVMRSDRTGASLQLVTVSTSSNKALSQLWLSLKDHIKKEALIDQGTCKRKESAKKTMTIVSYY